MIAISEMQTHNIEGCCTSGTPAPDDYVIAGSFSHLAGMDVYVSEPRQVTRLQETILILPDGFGMARHNLMLADLFAEKGWHTIVPDYYKGEPLPISILRRKSDKPNVDIPGWLTRHPHEEIDHLLKRLILEVRSVAPETQLFATGFCFGGKHAFRMAKHGFLKASVSFHPSFVTKEDIAGIDVPLYIGLAANDVMVPASLQQDLETWTGEGGIVTTLEVYPNVGHGFACRPDTEDPMIKASYQRAFDTTVSFLKALSS